MSARRSTAAAAGRLRCAIYTRKSSEEGLDQSFNSLHAQREACEAYVLSQAGEGWTALPTVYDDGGFSGGNMDRPSLAALMADVDAGRIDVVVVYKVDRLTRALADFAKIVERFDAKGVSFVSVTQAFNTTTSMGRLTLNVLLSFAQFEREVTGERTRDKIAASKAKGMWMGGNTPLGYDAEGRTLKINEAEAETVRHIFTRYLDLGSVHALRDELEVDGRVSKRLVSSSGRVRGGTPFGRGALFHLLSNRVYLGEITHKDQVHPGLHAAIVEREVFETVQQLLARKAGAKRRLKAGLPPSAPTAPLAGLVFDAAGSPMSPVSARKGMASYRYYVSSARLCGKPQSAIGLPRFPAPALETLVADRLGRIGLSPDPLAKWTKLRPLITRIVVSSQVVVVDLHIDAAALEIAAACHTLPEDDVLMLEGSTPSLRIAARLRSRGGTRVLTAPAGGLAVQTAAVDLTLLKALVKAEAWKRRLAGPKPPKLTELAAEVGLDVRYLLRLLPLAFLSPSLKRRIVEGDAPPGLTLQAVVRRTPPLAWADQERHLA